VYQLAYPDVGGGEGGRIVNAHVPAVAFDMEFLFKELKERFAVLFVCFVVEVPQTILKRTAVRGYSQRPRGERKGGGERHGK